MKPGRRWLASGSAALAAAAAAAVALVSCSSGHHGAAGTSLSGIYLVSATFNTGQPTPDCETAGAAKPGDLVTVTDADGNRLASGPLGQPQSSTRPADQRNLTTQLQCRWRFTTEPVPDRPSYQVQ